MPELRAVLDVNIWVSVIVSKKLEWYANLILENTITIFRSIELMEELESVLARPKIQRYLGMEVRAYSAFIEKITKPIVVERIFTGSPDIKDNYLFDIAIQSNSTLLVTGDKALLTMKNVDGFRVVQMKEFELILENKNSLK